MLSRFFIDRPIFANVIAIVTIIFGLVTLLLLPVEQYPQITPPTVLVSTVYPGASAEVVADTVAAPIEQQVNGVEHMLYMSSNSANDGSYSLTVTFEVGTNLDMAQVLVQNRVAIAEPTLPDDVKRQGVNVQKQSTSFIQFIALSSPDGSHDDLFLSNYATLNVRDELSRIEGVGNVSVMGSASYSMRVWLDPEKLKSRSLTTQDVVDAIQEQNVQVAAGQIGQPPAPAGQNFQYTVTTLGRLSDVEQFQNIIVKTTADSQVGARITRVKDVARVELGGQVYDQYFQMHGKPAAGIGIYQLPGANALDVSTKVSKKMAELSKSFPAGVTYDIPFDTTRFVTASIHEVYKTLIEAGILVLIVILVFLQDWRAVLVPATTVPVTIIGAFAAMAALGFTVNILTLFGLILAIGIVVDDAIVIVENAAHHIERGLPPREATIKAMDEIIGPVIGITLVLMAVFLPTAFLGGITGQLYRQFALTIAATAVISAINAVTLKPAQCALWLRKNPEHRNLFFRGFNAVYSRCEHVYSIMIAWMVRHTVAMLILFAVLIGSATWGFLALPTGFLPTEDQGYAIASVLLPDAASQERTREVVAKMNDMIAKTPGVVDYLTVGGYSVLDGTGASNAAAFWIIFKDWKERKDPSLSQEAILGHLRRQFATIEEGIAFVFVPPSIQGLGVAGGFQMQLQDRGGTGGEQLQAIAQEMVVDGEAQPGLQALNTTYRSGIPQLYVDVDRVKVKALNIPLSRVFGTLQASLGSAYVNDFNKFGRTYQVRVQADRRFRARSEDVAQLEVRSDNGNMVPLGTMVDVEESLGPLVINRYNLYPSAAVNGEAAPGYSSGQALKLMEQMAANKLPPSMSFDWTGMSYQEKKVGGEAFMIFGLAILLVYLVLAAQYESWTNPAAVILVVPLALLGTVIALALTATDNNIYTQIGIVLLIALASKNAILIVEFARELRADGKDLLDAAVQAARMRFRPILMTSFAFIMGIYPLVRAEGASAASRRALGTAVFGGMLASTFLAVLFVPVFYVVWQRLSESLAGFKKKPVSADSGTPPE
ncbi:efflux RND transporter permease subunit [Syntrophobacter fumaroxidans]|uniref:Transporter, hydrophobe/amphiphile efflux-1 (HAE1) family n=1 Tax=Syntrophobacter fumaroxidans (strain DSM 10017 / MPOB) TaxID=335543 RepID=A0LQ89_SYNFM|nr:multidrug efflux RND transporter permease subunit [Syntrophobacter fumaroxidans]ABK19591.1 transporter, hydrophobe/amphiphile efflux-1 (HAE1) family [Syntrophobacter fumaroxidans MPOB]